MGHLHVAGSFMCLFLISWGTFMLACFLNGHVRLAFGFGTLAKELMEAYLGIAYQKENYKGKHTIWLLSLHA